jgi:MoaA/NifB/PqqE/SkfB family radical SAM enzyme
MEVISPSACDAIDVDITMFNNAPFVTQRGAIDVGHVCDIECLFCYHRFEERGRRRFLDKETIMHRLKRDREEFSLCVTDFTGGEPTIHPDVVEIVEYGYQIGNRICLITHGQWKNTDKIDRIIDAGVEGFLMSIHGTGKDHDELVKPGAFDKVMRSIAHLERRGVKWRVNCVANSHNMGSFGEFARTMSDLSHPPENVNFIVFSPLAGWTGKDDIDFQAKHSDLAPFLKEAIEIFNDHGIWTNVRYYPLCMMKGLERHVTCFPQICYDPLEWDYRSYGNMTPRFIAEVFQLGKKARLYAESDRQLFHNTWSLIQSQRFYRKGPQCTGCSYRLICDGVAGQYASRYGFEELIACSSPVVLDPIHFRRHHEMAVGEAK